MSSIVSNPISSVSASPASVGREEQAAAAIRRGQGYGRAEARLQLNAGIVTQSLEVSIQAGNEPLALLYRSAIDRINELLAPEFGDNAIQNAASDDNSPEATAARIVSLSTGFFEAYKAQHPDENPAEQLSNFMALISKGFEQGFADASEILQGLGVLDGEIGAGIDRTYALVRKGYEDFITANSAGAAPATGTA